MKKNEKIGFIICILFCISLIIFTIKGLTPEPINSKPVVPKTTDVAIEIVEETILIEPIQPIYIEDYITQEEIEMIAKVLYREARGVEDKDQIAAVAWCILNRVDHPNHPNTIKEVITQPEQFAWTENTPIEPWLLELSEDVVYKWCLEKEGSVNVGRTLPSGYCFFVGDGVTNHFRKDFTSKEIWDWSLPKQY